MKAAFARQVWDWVEASQTIGISGHTGPDGDAIGSSCALALALRSLGKDVYLLAEPCTAVLHEIPGWETAGETAPACDLFFALDCGDAGRLGIARPVFEAASRRVCIDHHRSNSGFADLSYIDPEASSTSELVGDLLTEWGLPLTREVAAALYIGMLHDTGGFRHRCTHPSTLRLAARCMEAGIPFTEIQERQMYNQTYPQLKLLGLALEKAQLLCGGRLLWSAVTQEEMQEQGGDSKDLDRVVGTLKNVFGVRLALFFYEKAAGEVKASLRSDGTVDVSVLAQRRGGGGHIRAAGCTLRGTMEQAIATFLPEAVKSLE